jgi:tryptophanyl-tRNA synthetase
MSTFPTTQMAPAFASSHHPSLNLTRDMMCLIPCGLDQDIYFRLTRDNALSLKEKKPALIHSKFMPSLLNTREKMSASDVKTCIFLTDDDKNIKLKIMTHAFSGGGNTLAEHKKHGANLEVDVSYQYLVFLLEDDDLLLSIKEGYSKGEMTTADVKKILINLVTRVVHDFQSERAKIDDKMVKDFMTIRPINK